MAALLLTFAAAAGATDLRGRVDSRNAYTGLSYPRGGARVQLTQKTPKGPVVVRSTYSGSDGMYYFPGIAPGNYVLVVNNQPLDSDDSRDVNSEQCGFHALPAPNLT